jgi:hypothetical protein
MKNVILSEKGWEPPLPANPSQLSEVALTGEQAGYPRELLMNTGSGVARED